MYCIYCGEPLQSESPCMMCDVKFLTSIPANTFGVFVDEFDYDDEYVDAGEAMYQMVCGEGCEYVSDEHILDPGEIPF